MAAEVPLTLIPPTSGGDAGTWGLELNAIIAQIAAAHNSLDSASLKLSQLGNQVASIGLDGAVQQPPAPHSHNITVKDSGGTTYSQPGLDVYAGSGNVQQDIANNVIKLLLTPADVNAQRVATQLDNVTTVTTMQSIPDLTKTIPAGTTYEFGALLGISSTGARGARVGVTFGGSPTYYAAFMQPHIDAANTSGGATPSAAPNAGADILRLRSAIITTSTNGPQQMGGFASGGSANYSLFFGVVSNTDSVAHDMTWSFSPGVVGVAGTTSVLPLITRVSYARVTLGS